MNNSYLIDILGKIDFYQWIDGSYITRKADPKDIDRVSFVDFEVYEKVVTSDKLKNEIIRAKFNLDTYFVAIYPKNHPKYFSFEADSAHWYNWFNKTNPKHDRRRIKYSRSFIQINHK